MAKKKTQIDTDHPTTAETRAKRETALVADLKPHPKNYRTHGETQLAHLRESITTHGFYRNVVITRDGTILAGHGVVEAARSLNMIEVPVVRVDLEPDDPLALKILIGDNQIGQLAEIDDRELTDMLKVIKDSDFGLLGTGYDASQLAALVMTTRPEHEIQDKHAAEEWIGMPAYDAGTNPLRVIVNCVTEADRDAFFEVVGALPIHIVGQEQTRSIWWPLRARAKAREHIYVEQSEQSE